MKKAWPYLILLVGVLLIAVARLRQPAELQAGDLRVDEEQNTYVVEFFDEETHRKFASAYVRVDPVANGLSRVFIQFWHRDKTHLRSLSLKFHSSQWVPDLSLNISDYAPSPAFQISRKDVNSISLQIDDLGFYGSGTYNLEFLLDSRLRPEPDLSLGVQMVLISTQSILARDQSAAAKFEIGLPEYTSEGQPLTLQR